MSTLSTANIKSKAANTPPVVKDSNDKEVGQFCRAYVNFDGLTGTHSIRKSFNVSSITDHTNGDYTVSFTNAMADADYVVSGGVSDPSSGQGYRWLGMGSGHGGNFSKTTSGIRVQSVYTSSSKFDAPHMYVVIHGD